MKLLLDTGDWAESEHYHLKFKGITFEDEFLDVELESEKDIKKALKKAMKNVDISIRQQRGRQPRGVYYDTPAGFSLSSSSFKYHGEKIGVVYRWALCINKNTFVGSTIEEFVDFCKLFNKMYKDASLCIFCERLPVVYQWLKGHLEMSNVFETRPRKVLSCNFTGIELRDFESLSGLSVSEIAPVCKVDEKRPSGVITPDIFIIPDIEVNTARIITAFINNRLGTDLHISKVPYTKTSYVRRQFRSHCLPNAKKDDDDKQKRRAMFRSKINRLKLDEKLYRYSKRALQGGLTCVSEMYRGSTMYNVSSFDLVSSYIAELCSKEYPCSNYIETIPETREEFNKYITTYLSIFDITFNNIRLKKDAPVAIFPSDKCFESEELEEVGKKLFRAKSITTTITSVDFENISSFYEWDTFSVGTLFYFKKGYLPKPLIEKMLDLYEQKTYLKGVAGKEIEYDNAKSQLDSIYGMMVTDVKYQADSIEDYNKEFSRFIYYPWGVFCTAYARRTLCKLIKECGDDFVYCDTDCVKMLNMSNHIDYIKRYQKLIKGALDYTCTCYGINKEYTCPKNVLGEKKQLGSWNYEGTYDTFKALKPKMYMYSMDNKLSVTCAGVSKEGITAFMNTCKEPFKVFSNKLEIPKEYSGKKVYTYTDEPIEGYIEDCRGKTYHFKLKTSVYMEEVPSILFENEDEEEFEQFKKLFKYKIEGM